MFTPGEIGGVYTTPEGERIAVVKDGVVVNVVMGYLEGDKAFVAPEGHEAVPSEFGNIGDSYDGERFVSPHVLNPPPPIVPKKITRVQFARALKNAGELSQAEALGFIRGVIPQRLADAVATIQSQVYREDVELVVAGEQQFDRDSYVTENLRVAMGWSDLATDDLWIAASQL